MLTALITGGVLVLDLDASSLDFPQEEISPAVEPIKIQLISLKKSLFLIQSYLILSQFSFEDIHISI